MQIKRIRELKIAPATLSDQSVTLVWEKPKEYQNLSNYQVFLNDRKLANRLPEQTHTTISGLSPDTSYEVLIEAHYLNEKVTHSSIQFCTLPKSKVIDVSQKPYFLGEKQGSKVTEALQKAILECSKGGTVWIPKDLEVTCGSIDLKSDMTLKVDGTIRASQDPNDYLISKEDTWFEGQVNEFGMPLSRYEGWELYCYRSLINIGYIDPTSRSKISCENVRIAGEGRIIGGGNELGIAMREIFSDPDKFPEYVSDGTPGRRSRGRLICAMQTKNFHLTGVSIEQPSCWTVHMIYCDTVTTHGISIKSRGIDNGDGWDPDSSKNLMIFDTSFDTGDDCIALKSGKNPEGDKINIPTKNVRIFDLKMIGGHGMAIGSEQSGGIEHIYLRDCVIKDTKYGLELKAHNSRGGYIKQLFMQDCEIDRFLAHSVEYNADGEPAPSLPVFEDITILDTKITGEENVLELKGFKNPEHLGDTANYLKNVRLENIVFSGDSEDSRKVRLEACKHIVFKNVTHHSGEEVVLLKDSQTTAKIQVV